MSNERKGRLKTKDARYALQPPIITQLFHLSLPDSITSWVVIFILPINSALNPIIYTLTTRPFKEMIHQLWHNYRQRRSVDRKETQKAYAPSFIWVEMWPLQEMSSGFMKPGAFTDSNRHSHMKQYGLIEKYNGMGKGLHNFL